MNESELRKQLLTLVHEASADLSFEGIYGVFCGVCHHVEVLSTFEIVRHVESCLKENDE
jgi:hypothetical protein